MSVECHKRTNWLRDGLWRRNTQLLGTLAFLYRPQTSRRSKLHLTWRNQGGAEPFEDFHRAAPGGHCDLNPGSNIYRVPVGAVSTVWRRDCGSGRVPRPLPRQRRL